MGGLRWMGRIRRWIFGCRWSEEVGWVVRAAGLIGLFFQWRAGRKCRAVGPPTFACVGHGNLSVAAIDCRSFAPEHDEDFIEMGRFNVC